MAALDVRAQRGTGRLLAAAVRGEPLDGWVEAALPASGSWPGLASTHGIGALLANGLRDDPRVPSSVLDALRDESYRVAMVRRQVLADLDELGAVLRRENVDFLVFKGPVLGEFVDPEPGQRSYGDLDVLVRAGELGTAVDALESAGFRLVDQNWDLLHRARTGEVHLIGPSGTPIDLHWHLVNQAGLRELFSVDVDALFERSRQVSVGAATVATLDAVDTLVYVCLHAALAGGTRLVWVRDVAMCGMASELEWDGVVIRSREWAVVPPLALMLARARRVMGLRVPATTWTSLGEGRRYANLVAPLERAFPVELDRGARSLTALVARSCRDTSGTSAKELARRVARWVGTSGPRFGEPTRTSRDSSDPSSPLYPTGGPGGRRAFFASVATERW
jgi:hypothetical protein